MRRTAIVSLALALLVPAAAEGQPDYRVPNTADCDRLYGGATYAPLIRRAWAERKWEQKDPVTKAQARRIENHRRCARTPQTLAWMIKASKRQRRQFKEHRRRKLAEPVYDIDPPGAAYLYGLRMCESGGNYGTNTGNGYYGAYQFSLSTWASVGGSGLPSNASPAEQDYRAALLWRTGGSGHWPVCG